MTFGATFILLTKPKTQNSRLSIVYCLLTVYCLLSTLNHLKLCNSHPKHILSHFCFDN